MLKIIRQSLCKHTWSFWSSTKDGFNNRRKMRTCSKCGKIEGRYNKFENGCFVTKWIKEKDE